MQLTSIRFILFFSIVIFLLYLIQQLLLNEKKHRIQLILLLVASAVYIAMFDICFALCLAVYVVFIYGCTVLMRKKERIRKPVLIAGIVGSVLLLAFFKYTNFFIESWAYLTGIEAKLLQLILPAGLSFYTFSGLALLLDLYRGKITAYYGLLDTALYLSYFPKLIAGPIERPDKFLSHIKEYKGICLRDFSVGLQIFIFGLFKKIVLADRLAVFVNAVYSAPQAYSSWTVALAVLSYAMQIYFDFSGYSDMAIGVSRMLGVNLERNFNLPYWAQGMSDFWKRWHISLSSWFGDYLYIPLGGNRKGKIRTYINLIIVMLISGLWHGAGVTFLVWGLGHGIASCISHLFNERRKRFGSAAQLLDTFITFLTVTLLWIVFRADTLTDAWLIFKCLLPHGGVVHLYTWSFVALTLLLICTLAAVIRSKRNGEKQVNGFYPNLNLNSIFGLTLFLIAIGIIILTGYFGNTVFIYGNF